MFVSGTWDILGLNVQESGSQSQLLKFKLT